MEETRVPAGEIVPGAEESAVQSPIEDESLIEEVSIDGMCGVY